MSQWLAHSRKSQIRIIHRERDKFWRADRRRSCVFPSSVTTYQFRVPEDQYLKIINIFSKQNKTHRKLTFCDIKVCQLYYPHTRCAPHTQPTSNYVAAQSPNGMSVEKFEKPDAYQVCSFLHWPISISGILLDPDKSSRRFRHPNHDKHSGAHKLSGECEKIRLGNFRHYEGVRGQCMKCFDQHICELTVAEERRLLEEGIQDRKCISPPKQVPENERISPV